MAKFIEYKDNTSEAESDFANLHAMDMIRGIRV